jgi:hypothetical protein
VWQLAQKKTSAKKNTRAMTETEFGLCCFVFIVALIALVIGSLGFVNSNQPLVRTRATLSSSIAVLSTTASGATSLLAGGKTSGSFTLGANSCSENTVIRFKCGMTVSGTPAAGKLLTFGFGTLRKPEIAGALVPLSGVSVIVFQADIVVREAGACASTTSVLTESSVFVERNPGTIVGQFDTSVANTMDFSAAWLPADADQTLTVLYATMETLN